MSDLASVVNPECPGCQALLVELKKLTARVEELERRLDQNSQNSHQPPSADPPAAKEQTKRARPQSGKSRGGQKGHKRRVRALLPAEEVDEVHELVPLACRGCGHALRGTDAQPLRHQVTELPELRPTTSEYRLHALDCACCGKTTRAVLPQGVPHRPFGPRLVALVATLTAHYRLSKDKAQELLRDVLGIVISTGGLSNLEAVASAAVAAPVDEARREVQKQKVVYVDETRWPEQGEAGWLWVVVTKLVVVFVIRPSRGAGVAKELLGTDFQGTATTDRYTGYAWLDRLTRQLCWAHLVRDFRKMAQVKDEAASAVGVALLKAAQTLFDDWERLKKGTLRRSSFRAYASALRQTVRQTLEKGAQLEHELVSGMCRAMRKVEASMWTFVRVEGVEPTNNDAEREVRHGVIYRKLSYGTQSERGSRFVERMLTVRATLRRQGRNVFQFLVDACEAAGEGDPAALSAAGQRDRYVITDRLP